MGCGFGWFAQFARENGAVSVHSIDLSENMLGRAQNMTSDDKIRYERADLGGLKLEGGRYDPVFSSLTFHYLVNLPSLMKEISKGLKPSGRLVFSIEHPVYTAPSKPGFVVDEGTGRKFWPLDDYQREGLRTTNWLAESVKKQHRTIGTYINILLSSGLRLTDFLEWYPNEGELKRHPERGSEVIRPTFLLIGAAKD
ncbi:hypothetical protein AAE478_002079 [Parahypoxylon ruwenzoriense]